MQVVNETASNRFLTFCVDAQLYALRAEDVSEVMLLPTVAHIPQAPAALLGVANLRGSVLPVASLRKLLNKPEIATTANTRAIVLDIGAAVALVVDSVEMLEAASPQQIDSSKNELNAAAAEKLLGVFAIARNNTVARILDVKSLLEAAFANRARQQRQTAKAATTIANSTVGGDSRKAEALVTFDVGGQEFALPLTAVQEIIPLPSSMTAVPRTEAVVLGVIAVRDALLPLLSLRGLLGFAPKPANAADNREKVVIMNVAGAQVGLVTERARAIVAADAELVDPIPSVLAARTGGESRIKAIYRGDAGRRLISILSPEQLFREDVMQKLLAEQQRQHTHSAEVIDARREELIFLVFKLGGDEFGLPVTTVVEVAQVPEQITRVPKTPKFLEGVINLRGEVLPVVDQRRRFDMPKLEANAARRLVVIQTERHRAGLIVDSVAEVLRVLPEAIEPPPDLTEATSRLVRGVINLEQAGRLVLVLDPAEVLTRAEQGLLDTFQAAAQKTNA